MATLRVKIKDLQAGKIRVRAYRGPRESLEQLLTDIQKDRAAHQPPGTAIHTPVPTGVTPGGFVASFLVVDPLVIEDEA